MAISPVINVLPLLYLHFDAAAWFSSVYQKQRSGLILQPVPPVHPKEKDILTPIPLELA
jgi:hypothetical protein